MTFATTPPLFGAPQTESTSDDYYTPSWLFEIAAVRFDVDVAAPPGGVDHIPAAEHWTKAEDGLAQSWAGLNVWCNPPYSKTTPWANKFTTEAAGGMFLGLASKSAWYPRLVGAADCVWIHPKGGFDFVGGSIFMPVVVAARGPKYADACVRLRDTIGGTLLAPVRGEA